MTKVQHLPHNFRKRPISERKKIIKEVFGLSDEDDLSDLSDILVESSIGTYPIPLGLATGFLIDGEEHLIPMATEEPSVIAGASYAARIIKNGGGFSTWADDPVMSTQIFLLDTTEQAEENIRHAEDEIHQIVNQMIPSMVARGGGYRGLDFERIDQPKTLCVTIHVDVRNAMGANVVNTIAEGLRDTLSNLSGGHVLMSILSNGALRRKAGASFEVPAKYFHRGEWSGDEICKRIELATQLANACPSRAVTHNKGIMNGISALTLATGNDTRAIEAGAHAYAQRNGQYRSLTSFSYENNTLKGSIELPLALGTVGGSIGIWPASQVSLKILGHPDAQQLSRIAAALGLAQNLSAVFALVSEGIQSGHMKLHAAKIAYSIGARGDDIRPLAAKLWQEKALDETKARKIYSRMKSQQSTTPP